MPSHQPRSVTILQQGPARSMGGQAWTKARRRRKIWGARQNAGGPGPPGPPARYGPASHSFQDRVELSQERQLLPRTGQGGDDDCTIPPLGSEIMGWSFKKREFDVLLLLHSFQDTETKLHRYVKDFTGQVVYGLMILPYLLRGQTWRVNHSENVNSTWIRTVSRMQGWNFTVFFKTLLFYRWHTAHKVPRDDLHYVSDYPGQVLERLTILPYPRRGQKWRFNHSKNVNAMCICTVFKIQIWNFTGTSMTPGDRSWRGWLFYRFPEGSGVKGWPLKKCSHSFKIQSWNFTGTSATPRDRSGGWRFNHTPRRVRNEGLITQQT